VWGIMPALGTIAIALLSNFAIGYFDVRPAGVWYGVESPRPKREFAVRLATYNVENLFDGDDDPSLSGEHDDLAEQTSGLRLKALSAVIRNLNADVLCLQEVESQKCLKWFRDTYLADLGYEHIASIDAMYYRGVEQSILSRFPITSARVFTGEDFSLLDAQARCTPALAQKLGGSWAAINPKSTTHFQRAPLVATVQLSDRYALSVVVVHSKAGGFDHQRELEAIKVGDVVSRVLRDNPSCNLAVLGDFNATPNSMSVKVLRAGELELVSAYDFRWNPQAPFATYATHSSGRPLDYIFMSRALAADCVPDSYFVLGTLHPPSSWDYRRAKEIPPPDGYASDHYPVVVDLDVSMDRGPEQFEPRQRGPAGSAPATTETPSLGSDSTGAPGKTEGSKQADQATQPKAGIPIAPAKPADLKLRPLSQGQPSADDIKRAERLIDAGWKFQMPRPKSARAGWGVADARTTWWPGYWLHAESGRTSKAEPNPSDGFAGDNEASQAWRNGGAPPRPTIVEWLCSDRDGIEPETGG